MAYRDRVTMMHNRRSRAGCLHLGPRNYGFVCEPSQNVKQQAMISYEGPSLGFDLRASVSALQSIVADLLARIPGDPRETSFANTAIPKLGIKCQVSAILDSMQDGKNGCRHKSCRQNA